MKYGAARFKLDHSHALSREQYHISVKCMMHFRLICSHNSKYHERYTRAPRAISAFAREVLMSIQ